MTVEADPVLELFNSTRKSLRDRLVRGDAIFDVPPPRRLVGDLLQSDSLAAFYGAPASGKTFVALDIGLSVASRRLWQGKEVVDGPVLYIVAEDAPGISKRCRAWRSRYGDIGNDVHWLLQRVPLLEGDYMAELCDIVAEIAPALVIVDTLAKCMIGAEESSSRDMGLAIDGLDRLRAVTNSCVAVVHHGGKDPSRGMRGSNALLAAVDTAVECRRTHGGITATVIKQKNAPDGERLHFTLDPELDSAVLVESSVDLSAGADGFRPTVLMTRVSRFLEGNADASIRAIRAAKLGRAEYVDIAVGRLVAEGFVSTTPGPRGATLHRSLAPFQEGDDDAL